jgi:competence protein ComEC
MKILGIVLVLSLTAVMRCSGQDLDKEIAETKRQIAEQDALAQPRTAVFLQKTGDAQVNLNESLFNTIFDQIKSLPQSTRTARIRVTDKTGDFARVTNDDVLGCYARGQVDNNRYRADAIVSLSQLDWTGTGLPRATGNVNIDATATLIARMELLPYPDIECHFEQKEVCVLGVCVKVPLRVSCNFHGWRPCSEGNIVRDWQLGSVQAYGNSDQPIHLQLHVDDLGELYKRAIHFLVADPTLTATTLGQALNVPAAQAQTILDRFSALKMIDSGSVQPLGLDFANGPDHWFYYEGLPEEATLTINQSFTVRLPNPHNYVYNTVCIVFRDPIMKPFCDLTDKIRDLIPININFLRDLDVRFGIKANEQPIPSPLFSGALPIRVRESVSVPTGLESKPSYQIADFNDPFSNRALTVGGGLSSVTLGNRSAKLSEYADINWADIMAFSDYLQVHFIDVGQGDAIWIKTPRRADGTGGSNIVIDGGPEINTVGSDGFGNRVTDYLRHFGFPEGSTIDYLILTHPHQDHYTGLIDLAKNYRIKTILLPKLRVRHAGFKEFVKAIHNASGPGAPVEIKELTGEQPVLSVGSDISAKVIYSYMPAEDLGRGRTRESNSSIVMKVQFGKFSYLLMGDALGRKKHDEFTSSSYVESLLIRDHGGDLASTILKVGDHASAASSTNPFLGSVAPQIAVVSAGHERVNGSLLPNDSTLNRISDQVPRVTLIRTDDSEAAQGIDKFNKVFGNDVFAATDGQQLVVFQEIRTNGKRQWVKLKTLP